MTKLAFALITLILFSGQAAEGKEQVPHGLRCESVKKSAVLDLPGFCESQLDKRRLVDYGFQLDMLEKCAEAPLAKSIKTALQAKVFRDDVRGCAEAADSLARSLSERK